MMLSENPRHIVMVRKSEREEELGRTCSTHKVLLKHYSITNFRFTPF